jgi:ligand-binding sensor domain-containing protein
LKYYLLFFFCLTSLLTAAQQPYYINYTIADGLPSDNVYSVSQDIEGCIWFTTDVGIVKYDSKSFKLLNTDNGLSDNEVFKLSWDSKGRAWMHTLNGKVCYIYKNRIYNESNSPLLKQIKGSGLVVDFYEDAQKNVYLSFRSGEIFIIDSTDKVEKKTNLVPHWGVWKDDVVYAVNTGTVTKLEDGLPLQVLKVDPRKSMFSTQSRLCHVAGGNFFSSGNELYIEKQNRLYPYLHLESATGITNVNKIDDYLWVTTRSGLYQYDSTLCINHLFSGDAVSDILRDKEGNYWVTTLNRGVLMVPSMQVLKMLDNKKIHRLNVNEDALWLGGTENDYYVKNKAGFANYHLPADWLENKITCFRFFEGNTYIGAKSGLVMKGSNGTRYFRVNVNDLLYSDKHIYLATTYTAKVHIDNMDEYIVHTPAKDKLLSKRTNVLERDDEGNIWIGTNFGLYLYASEAGEYKLYNMGELFDELAISIEDLFFDSTHSYLLVATASKGLVVLKDRKVTKVIKTQSGLNNNTATAIKKIADNTYLVGTNNGLNKVLFTAQGDKVDNYNFQLGITNKRVNDIEFARDTVYLATDNGVLYFNINKLAPINVYPSCNITAIKTTNGLLNGKPLDHADNDISISFNGISFKDKGNVDYYYRFAGKGEVWNMTKESQINYKDLAPGKYTFELYCKNGMGNKSPVNAVSFEILPPFWQEPWFVALCAIVVASMGYGYTRFRLKKQHAKNEIEKQRIETEKDRVQLEKQMLELEQKALRMQMNPHFIFNALNTIKGYYSEGNDIKAGNYIAKFSKLLRMLLNSEGQNTTLDTEIEMLRLYVELTRIRYHKKFDYTIYEDPELMSIDIIIPSLLLQPIVENAIMHGLAAKTDTGNLLISFQKKGEQMVCIVEDDGVGRAQAAIINNRSLHNSKAISIVKDRLRLFDEHTSFEIIDMEQDGVAKGTKVIIKLPIKYT